MKKLLALVVIATSLGACAAPSNTAAAPADHCLFKPDKPVKVSVMFEGETVGFCCDKCKGKFEGMDTAAKKDALAKRGSK